MYKFLKDKGIEDDILKKMKDEKITMETVAKLGPHNQELAQFLCLGDRMELLRFCTEKPVFGLSENSKRKKRHYDSIKKKMMLAVHKPGASDEESDEEMKKKHKMMGNQNAKKETRIIEFGWYHDGVNVRGRLGGGTRKLTVAKTCTKDDLLEEAKQLYFPDGISRRNVKTEDCTFSLRDFMHNPLDDGITVGKLSDSVKMTGRLRFYMYSTDLSGPDSEKCRESQHSPVATLTSELETSVPLKKWPNRRKGSRKLSDFPTTAGTSTEANGKTVSAPKSTVSLPYTHESTNTLSETAHDELLVVDGNYWPPVAIDSEIIFGRDPNGTGNLSETIAEVPLGTEDFLTSYSMVGQPSTSLAESLLQPSTLSFSPLYDPQITPFDSFGQDPLTSTPSFGPQSTCSLPSPVLEPQIAISSTLLEPQYANPSILPEVRSANPSILPQTPSANTSVLPKLRLATPSTLPDTRTGNPPILTEPQLTHLLILSEPQSRDSSILSEQQSAIQSILPETRSVSPSISEESRSASLSILPEPRSANSSVLPETRSADPSILDESQSASPSIMPEPRSASPSILPEPRSANTSIPPEPRSANPSVLPEQQFANSSYQPEARSPTPPRLAERNIRIRRITVQNDMIANFKDPAVIEQTVTFTFVDERGVDVQGVSRDAYTSFWEHFVSSSTKGEQERVPSIMPKFQKEDWMAIGRILLKGFCDQGIFPIQISRAFFVAMLYGEQEVSQDLLLDSFKKYVTDPERIVVEKALQGVLEEDDDKDEFQDLLGRMDCSAVPSSNTNAIILQVAHTELIQQGKYALDAIASVAKESLVANLPTPDCLLCLYKSKEPSYRKVIKLLKVEPSNTQENNIFNYLKQLIRGLTPELLVRFLHFVTGARCICVDKIEIAFNKAVGLARVPIARTCGPVLELSVSYLSFTEFRQEFLNVLSSNSSQRFDID